MAHDWHHRFEWTEDDLHDVVLDATYKVLKDQNDRDDILQEMFLVTSDLPLPDWILSKVHLKRYVSRIARNRAYGLLNKRNRVQKRLASALKFVPRFDLEESGSGDDVAMDHPPVWYAARQFASDPDDWLAVAELSREHKEQILQSLPASDEKQIRKIVGLHLDGLNGAEIAKQLCVSQATVSRRLKVARKHVRPAIGEIVEDLRQKAFRTEGSREGN